MPLIETITFRGGPAWRVTASSGSPRLCLVVSATGGHLCSLTSDDGAPGPSPLSPLWQPSWPASTPAAAAAEAAARGAEGTWGEGPEAPLLASICGSNLCLDRFGPCHAGDAPRPLHGEAGVATWVEAPAGGGGEDDVFAITAELPIARLRVTRRFALAGAALALSTTAVQLGGGAAAAPHLTEWCEHTTLGGAFLDGVAIEAGVDSCHAMPAARAAEPAAVPLAAALAVPAAGAPAEGHVRSCRVVEGRWVASNAALGWRLSASWAKEEFPWLCLWTEHRSRAHNPWRGAERTRGMEISTKPFPEGEAPPARAETFLGRPATFYIPPGEAGVTKTVTLTWERM